MAYIDEENIPYRLSELSFGASAKGGPKGVTVEKAVDDEKLMVGTSNTPIARPFTVDATARLRFADASAVDDETEEPADVTAEFEEAGGGAGSHATGPYVPRGFVFQGETGSGGIFTEGEYRMKGDAFTKTITV